MNTTKENKKKLRKFWGWKLSKNKNIEPHQSFTGSYKKECSRGNGSGNTYSYRTKRITSNILVRNEKMRTKHFICKFWTQKYLKTQINTKQKTQQYLLFEKNKNREKKPWQSKGKMKPNPLSANPTKWWKHTQI